MLIADDQDIKTYDQENDRELSLIGNQLRTRAVDYLYDASLASVVIWTDTSSKIGTRTKRSELCLYDACCDRGPC